ncbi:alpha/beta hydrolase [Actinocatenispora sera]|uniref:alpha/beta fold hydrolase n=1 Tax=Actinocatenispora sera TaxID=390989 RepID=UPI0033F99CEC
MPGGWHSRSELRTVDGELVHVVDGGTGPVVLFCCGLGQSWFDWDAVVPLLRGYRLVRLDRPGLGLSPRSARPSTLDVEAARIAAAADRFSPAAPVTVVAHSAAALHAEAYARTAPDRLAGLVFVDPSYEPDAVASEQPLRGLETLARQADAPLSALLAAVPVARLIGPPAVRLAYRLGTARRLTGPDRPGWPPRPDPVPDALDAVYSSGETLASIVAELAAYRGQAVALRAMCAAPFPPVPVRVLAATYGLGTDRAAAWSAATAALAAELSAGHQVLPDAAHLAMLDRPDAVATAVRSLAPAHP